MRDLEEMPPDLSYDRALVPVSSDTLDTLQETDRDRLADEASGYAARSRSENTRRAYRSDWSHFLQFCALHNFKPLPATPETVALYITSLARDHKASTIRRRLSSISTAHNAAGAASPTREAAVRTVWDGIKRTLGTAPVQKAAAVAADIRLMVKALPSSIKSEGGKASLLLVARDRALLLIGFAGGFRRSELTSLSIGDLRFSSRGLTITIRRSKTDQEGLGRQLAIAPQPDPDVCPVRALKAWLKALGEGRQSEEESEGRPVFSAINRHGHISSTGLSPYAVALIVKRAAAAAGLDETKYAGHSLRSGFATSASEAGASDRSIMRTTGHRSREMVDRYIRSGQLFNDNASSLIRI
jgi:site-specific recombinase XerD